jgi:hypothetical protein
MMRHFDMKILTRRAAPPSSNPKISLKFNFRKVLFVQSINQTEKFSFFSPRVGGPLQQSALL